MEANIELLKEGKKITYVLSAGIDLEKDNIKFMPSLSFIQDYGYNHEKYLETWDNNGYIYARLFDVLLPWTTEKKIENPELFAEFLNIPGVCLEDFPVIAELIQKGIEFQFFEDIVKAKKKDERIK
jgi:hypothetical protein